MNWITIAIGTLALGFGFYTIYIRVTSPEKFGKLAAMRKQFGDTAGTVVHTVAYSVLPIVAGITFIILGIQGGAVF